MSRARRTALALTGFLLVLGLVAGCARSVDGEALTPQEAAIGGDQSTVDSDRYENLLLECEILAPSTIARVVGGSAAYGTFVGAICRWAVLTGGAMTSVTFTWYEWGSINHEKEIAKDLGYETENIKIASQTAFTARDPQRPQICGVTARAPSRGVLTWWVEPAGDPGDPCAAPTELMELLLTGGQ